MWLRVVSLLKSRSLLFPNLDFIYTQSGMLYEKIPNVSRYNFTVPPQLKDSHAGDGLIGTGSTHHTTTYDPTPFSEINAMSFDKGKSDKQPGSKKKWKSKKMKTSNPQEISSGNRKPCYPCIICNEEHFVWDFPHRTKVSKMVNTSHVSAVLIDLFPNMDTNFVATDLAPSSQVLMLFVTKPLTNILVSTLNKDYIVRPLINLIP